MRKGVPWFLPTIYMCSLWIYFSQSKLINVAKKSTILFLENYPRLNKKFEEYLKLNSWNVFFNFSIIKLRFQLRYHCMKNNSKCDVTFFHPDKWQTTQNRTFWSNLWTSRTRKICQYHSPWVTKPVLCPFFHYWIYFWIVVQVFCT